jgi:hypothetical protein
MTTEIPKEAVIRRDHILIHPDGRREDCGSINQAKKKSIALQKSGTVVRALPGSTKDWNPVTRVKRYQPKKKRELHVTPTLHRDQLSQAARKFVGRGNQDGA